MCFYFRQSKEAIEVAKRFKTTYSEENSLTPVTKYNGFAHPNTPIIADYKVDMVIPAGWGLILNIDSDTNLRNFTLNARIETLQERRSYKTILSNRCLVLADGFYENKFLFTLPNENLFAFGGLYSKLKLNTGEDIITYTIVTTVANEIVASVHTKKRMPVILKEQDEKRWLSGDDFREFAYPYSCDLIKKREPSYGPSLFEI